MKKLKMAVIGKDVSKSLSPRMHTFILNKMNIECEYDAISILPEEFSDKIPNILKTYDAMNVTIPYKLEIIPYLKEIKADAKTFGAVNTVKVNSLEGYNTDGMGFILMLQNNAVVLNGKTALVLGSGGVGRSVIKKLLEAGCIVSAFDLNKDGLEKVHKEFPEFQPLTEIKNISYDIIVNCTGVGMHKTEGISPVGKELLSLCSTAVDLIYTPPKSKFLSIAEEEGKKIINGEAMLFYQAYFSDCIFLNQQPNSEFAKQLFEEYRRIK